MPYCSQKLDVVGQGLLLCVQAVVAASMAVQASADVVLFHPLTVHVPHAVSPLLTQNIISFLSPACHLSCMAVLLSQSNLTIECCTTLKPATLSPITSDGEPHNCLETSLTTYLPRPDLQLQSPPHSLWLFTDVCSLKNEHTQLTLLQQFRILFSLRLCPVLILPSLLNYGL